MHEVNLVILPDAPLPDDPAIIPSFARAQGTKRDEAQDLLDGTLIASLDIVAKVMGKSHPQSFPDYWYVAGGRWADIFDGAYMTYIDAVTQKAYDQFYRIITPRGYKYRKSIPPLAFIQSKYAGHLVVAVDNHE